MNANHLIRQTHRWLSIAFVCSVVTYSIVMTRGPVPAWLNAFPAGALMLMLVTGLYLFVLPYARRRRRPNQTEDPFATFAEWKSDADRKDYADL